ncbi:hypothetical protein K1719_039366 [Acacia pycnantha]|nr:hypothetical protein K1719_039366 [Acacia pycnantha]
MDCLDIQFLQLAILVCRELCAGTPRAISYGYLYPGCTASARKDVTQRSIYVGLTMGDGVSSCYLAPIHERGHWTLCVVCPCKNSCYWFDSVDGNPTEDIKNMFADGLKTYRELINSKEQGGPKWFKPTCHQQSGSTECGYYVMSWMQSIVNSGRIQGFQNVRNRSP